MKKLIVLLILLGRGLPVMAQATDPTLPRILTETGIVEAAALSLKKIEPDTCRWCSGPSWDKPASWVDRDKANKLSYATLGTVAAMSALMPLLDPADDGTTRAMRSAQLGRALAWTQLLTESVKILAARERPDGSDALSFWSEHSALAATSAAQLWKHGHKRTALFVNIPLVIATAWLRTSAGKHHPLDVIAGITAGAAIGLVLP